MLINTDSFAAIEKAATAYSKSHRGTSANVLLPTGETKITAEREVANALMADPSIYEDYRQAHNAAPILQQLRDAGIRIG